MATKVRFAPVLYDPSTGRITEGMGGRITARTSSHHLGWTSSAVTRDWDTYETTAVAEALPGYKFYGWNYGEFTKSSGYYDNSNPINGYFADRTDCSLGAIFVVDTIVTVSYYKNDGTGEYDYITMSEGTTTTIWNCPWTRSGYYFLGWAFSPSGSIIYYPGDIETVTNDIALYAIWEEISYTISGSVAVYDPSTGIITPGSGGKIRITASGLDTGQVTSVDTSWNDTYTTATAYPDAGYSFYGWGAFGDFNTSSTSSSNPVYGYVRDDGTADFYALFVANTYRTVYYYKNDGTSEQDYDTYEDGSTATVRYNTWTRSGYHFSGWSTSSTGPVSTYYYEGRQFTINSDVWLYAVWEAIAPQTWTMNPNSLSLTRGTSGTTTITGTTYGTITVSKSNDNIYFSRRGNTITITASNVGTATLTVSASGDATHSARTVNVLVTVVSPVIDYYIRIYNNGWHKAIPYVYNNGWKKCVPYIYNNGSWHKGG